MHKKQNIIKFTIITFVFIALFLVDFNIGFIKIPFKEILKFLGFSNEVLNDYLILIKEFRFPRVFAAILSGAALSISGLIMQTIFRNPLAGPSVLGISSGASLGVAITVLGTSFFSNISLNPHSNVVILIAAGLGSTLVLALILLVSTRVKDILSILIIGILVSGVVNSIVSILQYYANEVNVKFFVIWTMGSLNSISYNNILTLTPIILISIFLIFILSKPLNLILLGESFAKTMGVNTLRLRIFVFIGVSILTGAVTAYCGPLGFIGIVVPHISRWLFKTSNHFILIPASALIGSIFMLCGDLLTHIISIQGILPINAIIAILGVPFIIWIVVKNKRTIV